MKIRELIRNIFRGKPVGIQILVQRKDEMRSYNCVLEAYRRCFLFRDGAYHVGDHRIVQGFSVETAVKLFAWNKFDGHADGHAICKILKPTGCYDLAVVYKGFAVVLNSDILIDKGDVAWNFVTKLYGEYEKKHQQNNRK